MQVPVKVTVDTDTKEFTITIGTPPAAELIKKEAGVQKGAANPLTQKIADLKIEQIIKIAKMKEDALLGKNMFSKVKEIIGTCDSMGIMVEGKPARETISDINTGKYKEQIESGKTELSAEEIKKLEEEKKKLQEELKEKHEIFIKQANAIIKKMEGKEKHDIRKELEKAKIPEPIINELVPEEKEKPGAGKKK